MNGGKLRNVGFLGCCRCGSRIAESNLLPVVAFTNISVENETVRAFNDVGLAANTGDES